MTSLARAAARCFTHVSCWCDRAIGRYEVGGEDPPRCAVERAIVLLKERTFSPEEWKERKLIGAEWWFQRKAAGTKVWTLFIRHTTSPNTAAMEASTQKRGNRRRTLLCIYLHRAVQVSGVGWHYDKDESIASNQMRMVFPSVSTVTYLASSGAPVRIAPSPTPPLLPVNTQNAVLSTVYRVACLSSRRFCASPFQECALVRLQTAILNMTTPDGNNNVPSSVSSGYIRPLIWAGPR